MRSFMVAFGGLLLVASPLAAQPADLAQRKLVFDDEFNGTVFDSSKWTGFSTSQSHCGRGNPTNQQIGYALDQNAVVSGGILSLTAKRESLTTCGRTWPWTNARLQGGPSMQYAYIEVRSKPPAANGFRSAFWTWVYPGRESIGDQERDPYEQYSSSEQWVHFGGGNGGQGLAWDASDPQNTNPGPFNPTAGFHRYGADIRPDGTVFYVDGVEKFRSPPASNPLQAWNIIIDLAVCDNQCGGPPPTGVNTAVHQIDYVRAWSNDANLPAVTPQPGYDGPGSTGGGGGPPDTTALNCTTAAPCSGKFSTDVTVRPDGTFTAK